MDGNKIVGFVYHCIPTGQVRPEASTHSTSFTVFQEKESTNVVGNYVTFIKSIDCCTSRFAVSTEALKVQTQDMHLYGTH